MKVKTGMPHFSIIIPTRDRPATFASALVSVLEQSWSDLEIIVVNDGSAESCQREYGRIVANTGDGRVTVFNLPDQECGHGAGFARNFGAQRARSPYLGFLDDDDLWTDKEHLSRANAVMSTCNEPIDLYMTTQTAFLHDAVVPGPIWIEDLEFILQRCGAEPAGLGAYDVTVTELVKSSGFCHLNCLLIRRELFQRVGGLDETIRWEEDRDLYFRLVDVARAMKFVPLSVARHNVPDPKKRQNLSTVIGELERRRFQYTVFDRAARFSQHSELRKYARRRQIHSLKHIAENLAATRHYRDSAAVAAQALRMDPTAKWAAYTAWLALRSRLPLPPTTGQLSA